MILPLNIIINTNHYPLYFNACRTDHIHQYDPDLLIPASLPMPKFIAYGSNSFIMYKLINMLFFVRKVCEI